MKDLCNCGNEKDCRAKNCRPCSSLKLRTNFKCSVDGCEKDAWSKGFCPMHYRRQRLYGDPLIVKWGPDSEAWNYRGSFLGCWDWTGHFTNKGKIGREYGFVMIDGTRELVHRLVWDAIRGEIPEGLEVCHKCDNSRCWRPDHLFLGTHKENMADKVSKGRQNLNFAIGFRLPHTKLSGEDVLEIKKLWSTGEFKQTEIAKKFEVSRGHISRIVTGRSRQVVDDDREYAAFDRLKIYQRDNGICGICKDFVNKDNWELDHIIPLSKGGSDTYDNVQVAHPRCNRQKGNKMQILDINTEV